MNRNELSTWLTDRNIDFPRSASIAQLRRLFAEHNPSENSDGADDVLDQGVPVPTSDQVAPTNTASADARGASDTPIQESGVPLSVLRCPDLYAEEAALDVELRILEKRRQIQRLRAELGPELAIPGSQVTANFKDIKYSVLPFSGSDTYDAHKWLADFERACDSANGDDSFRLKSIRRLMKPETEAEWFLRTDSSNTYGEFRANFLANFGHVYTMSEIMDKMKKNTFSSSRLSVMGYILQMQELAARANIDEAQTIRFIIDGFRDRTANIAILYPATTIAQLKTLSHRYVQLREQSCTPLHPALRTTTDPIPKNTSKPIPNSTSVAPTKTSTLRCFNCSGIGHVSARCPEPKREHGTCFRCGSNQHVIRNCPKPAPQNTNLVALVDEFRGLRTNNVNESESDVVPEVNPVSVAFQSECSVPQCNVFLSLFDTGSPISLVQFSSVPSQLVNPATELSRYNGIGKFPLCTYGRIPATITFRGITKSIILFVVPDVYIPYQLLLGRNFLSAFRIQLTIDCTITKPKIVYNLREKNKLRISDNILHCVFGSVDDDCGSVVDCHLCRAPKPSVLSDNPDLLHIALIDSNFSIPSEGYSIDPKLNPFHVDAIDKIFRENYFDLSHIPEIKHDYKMTIRLTSDAPISYAPRRLSFADRQIAEKQVDELLARGFIRPSNSPYSFPIVLPPKKDGTKRMCVDYKPLKRIMIRDSFPLPLIDDCIERLEGKRYFSTLDLKNGFHHIRMDPDSVQYTSFVTPFGQYEYLVLPFGLKPGPSVFQRFIVHVLQEFIRSGSVVVYMDDITLASKTIPEHLDLLRRVLFRLAEFRLELKLSKCQICYSEIDFLGFTINQKGIRPNNKHIENIRHLPIPTNTLSLQRCLGLFSYFRRFVPSFSSIAVPLRSLLKPGVKFDFNGKCLRAFESLREKLSSVPVLALYNPKLETELHCDASSMGFGGILLQRQEVDKKFHPVAYFSRRATPAESRYHSYELETLAIVYSLRKFRIYLEGIPFKIITDCQALTLTLQSQRTNARIARWALELENYDYTIQYRSGALMSHVDALSRCIPLNPSEPNDNTILLVNSEDIDHQLQITQTRDEKISALKNTLENEPVDNYALEDGLVYRIVNDIPLLYVPREMETNVIRNAHEKLCHLGIEKCFQYMVQHYWFPKMRSKIERYIRNCLQCITHTLPSHSRFRTLHHIPKVPVPFDTIHVDHFGPLPSIQSKRKHLLVVIDAFTKFVKIFAVNTTSHKEVCACLDKYSEFYSRPRRLISDRGSCFRSIEFNKYLLDNNIELVKIASVSPQANGQVERINRIIKPMLAKLTEPILHSDWVKYLTKVEYAINNSTHSVTKEIPNKLLFGITQRGREVDVLTEHLNDARLVSEGYDLPAIRERASQSIRSEQKRSTLAYGRKHKPHVVFSENDYVMIRNVDTTVGTNKKFIPQFRGPYRVHRVLPNDRYVIRDIENCPMSQMPYDGIVEASRMRLWSDFSDPLDNTSVIDEQHYNSEGESIHSDPSSDEEPFLGFPDSFS